MDDIIVWPILLYTSWLAVIGLTIVAGLIVASVHAAHRDIAHATSPGTPGTRDKLLHALARWLLYFIPLFVSFFVLLVAHTDLPSALRCAAVMGMTASVLFSVHRALNLRLRRLFSRDKKAGHARLSFQPGY